MKIKSIFSLLSLLVLLFSCGEDGPTEVPPGTLGGNVLDSETEEAISGVEVTLNDNKVETTDQNGSYEFTDVPEGIHEISAKIEEYVLFMEEVSVTSGNNQFDIELEKMSSFCARTPTISYRGKNYNTITIGNQCWLKQSLNIGTMIDNSQDQSNNNLVEKYCYSNNESNCATYGGLYQWDEVMQYETTEGAQGICPEGWHIPTTEELDALINEVDNNAKDLLSEVDGGTNNSGFSALLAGFRDIDGSFHSLHGATAFWSSGEHNDENAIIIWFDGAQVPIFSGNDIKKAGNSVRCLKD
jgi:uncharacterized protein (TIGR02145 family)